MAEADACPTNGRWRMTRPRARTADHSKPPWNYRTVEPEP